MAVPPLEREDSWSRLSTEAKRERLLKAAADVFVRDGLDAPMPAVAAAAGAGVGSVYRQFPSKRELLAELVIDRLDEVAETIEQASERHRDRWSALTEALWILAERQATDPVLSEAIAAVSDHPDVVAARERATALLDRLMAGARDEGRLRADATSLDVQLLFAATRAARPVDPDAWRRVLELWIDAFDSNPPIARSTP
jgi:AcrR family transcriptional regulator